MNGLALWMEKHMLPVANKIGQQRHLAALRDSFLAILPATMVGAIAVMINAALGTFPQAIQQAITHKPGTFDGTTVPVIKDILAIDGYVSSATLSIIGLLFAISWGYHLSKSYGEEIDAFSGAIVSVGTLFAGLNIATNLAITLPKDIVTSISDAITADPTAVAGVSVANGAVTASGLNTGNLGATSYFAIIIMGGIATTLYVYISKANIKIKLPDSVPPMVSRPFEAILPVGIALYVISIVYYAIHTLTGSYVIDLIAKYIAAPITAVSQSAGAVFIVTAAVSVLWLCGLHGPNVLGGVLDGVWLPQLLENLTWYNKHTGASHAEIAAAVKSGELHLWVRNSFDIYAWMGGSGGTFVLLIAILIFSKRADYKTIAKLGVGPGFFNINEPVLFGLPIVLNPIFAIPFVVSPLVSVGIGYFATAAGMVNPAMVQTAWVTPPIMNAWMATGFDWRAIIVSGICLLVGFAIFLPFVLAANKVEQTQD